MFNRLAFVLAGMMLAATPALAQDAAAPESSEAAAPDAMAQDAPAQAAGSWLPSLITGTPEEGFALAVTMARKAVTTTQTDKDTLHKLRPAYSHDPARLIDVSGVVAAYFATIAEANDYWRG